MTVMIFQVAQRDSVHCFCHFSSHCITFSNRWRNTADTFLYSATSIIINRIVVVIKKNKKRRKKNSWYWVKKRDLFNPLQM